ncbi:unnamed protein product [Brachionus calyciflorus]|uniref:Integrase catalytic domain-containing protein n=1 Tax=Brachionus calyciflorus TaxID=104777 RepID=A0A813Q6Z9_9BILA|nr:unnamed protein product [Brachionus calyciflorus]
MIFEIYKNFKTIALIVIFSVLLPVPENVLIIAENKQQYKERFYSRLEATRIEKRLVIDPEKKSRKTKTYSTAQEYQQLIQEIEDAKDKKTTKSRMEYNLIRNYDVLTIGETKKIIKKKTNNDGEPIYLVPYQKLFDTLHKIHYDVEHKAPRHPQSQGSVERANADIKKMLATWMRGNKSLRWSLGIKFVQLKKNHSYHTGSKKSPFRTVFGIDTPLELTSTTIPLVNNIDETERGCTSSSSNNYVVDDANEVEDVVENEQDLVANDEDQVIAAANRLLGIRESVRLNQRKQAEKMRSKKYLPEVNIGDFVLVPIPEEDQGLTEAPHLVCRVVDVDYINNLYELVCEAGVLVDLFSRNIFDLVPNCTLKLEFRTDKQVKGIRQTDNESSLGGGQGMLNW